MRNPGSRLFLIALALILSLPLAADDRRTWTNASIYDFRIGAFPQPCRPEVANLWFSRVKADGKLEEFGVLDEKSRLFIY